MNQHVRLLPVIVAVAAGALALKAVAVAENSLPDEKAQATTSEAAAATPVNAGINTDPDAIVEEGSTEGDATEASIPENCPAGIDYASETGLSPYEIQVLRTLGDRRKEIEGRERGLETQEQLLAAAEKNLDAKIAELKQMESGILELLGQLDEQREERLTALVKVYEAMKAKDAAEIFEALDDTVLLDVASRMKNANLAAVLASMSPERARVVTRMLAARAALPENAEALRSRAG
jgi:flagellar motility protein MotE (MotC chaperone)